MNNKKYTENGYLIVSESDKCTFWEKDTPPCTTGWNPDCFFCRYADFRKPEYRQRMQDVSTKGKLYSVCRNEKNKKAEGDTV